jgi:hypothetical protein
MLSAPSPFSNSLYLFTLSFLSKQTGIGEIGFPSISFCLYVVALNVYRAREQCVG